MTDVTCAACQREDFKEWRTKRQHRKGEIMKPGYYADHPEDSVNPYELIAKWDHENPQKEPPPMELRGHMKTREGDTLEVYICPRCRRVELREKQP